jgi:hypothetical protein
MRSKNLTVKDLMLMLREVKPDSHLAVSAGESRSTARVTGMRVLGKLVVILYERKHA